MVSIDYSRCKTCALCVENCPAGVFELFEDEVVVVNPEKCFNCCKCVELCPEGAVSVEGC